MESRRLRVTFVHLVASLAIACLAWWLVFRIWYPSPLDQLAGGGSLFLLLVCVDVVIGPALTSTVASAKKSRSELTRDLTIILALQTSALGYGMYVLALARPVVIAFEADLFRVVTAGEVDRDSLAQAPVKLRSLSWTGPVLLAALKPSDPGDQLRTIELGLAGIPLSSLPAYWNEYPPNASAAWNAAEPVSSVLRRRPGARASIERIAANAGVPVVALRTLPVLARRSEWLAIIASPDARIVGYLPLDDGS